MFKCAKERIKLYLTKREILMSIFDELTKIETAIAAIQPTMPIDLSTLATAAEIAALSAKVDALTATVGTAPVAAS